MVLSPGMAAENCFDRPVVVLMNGNCFSATDVFLSGLKGLPNVTLVGTASGGGRIRVRLGTMISFQSDGRMFDTHGVEPDVRVEPTPESFIVGQDSQLQRGVRVIEDQSRNKAATKPK